jgi:glycosyltransferase involved in cell wall biosynthesis
VDKGLQIDVTPAPTHGRRLAFVLWEGVVGGAENFSVTLAQRMRTLGVDIEVVFIAEPFPIAERLSSVDVPYRSLGFRRGRDIAWHLRRYADEIARIGPDGALLGARGFMSSALRCGGYRGPIVAIEHGSLLGLSRVSWLRRSLLRVGGVGGAWASDAEVGVSDFMLDQMRRHPHARETRRIHNGIYPSRYTRPTSPQRPTENGALVVAFAGRLIAGKGADCLIEAVAQLRPILPLKLLLAGDGPERPRLEALARSSGVSDAVRFVGLVNDMPAFWRASDVAVVPSEMTESFSMTTLEGMACAKPVLATRSGGIPELVIDSVTGTIVPPGDASALARALVTYAEQPELRLAHGAAGRARVIEHFHINDCAQAYLDLFDELATARAAQPQRQSDGRRP